MGADGERRMEGRVGWEETQKQEVVARERKKNKQRCWMSWQTVWDANPAPKFYFLMNHHYFGCRTWLKVCFHQSGLDSRWHFWVVPAPKSKHPWHFTLIPPLCRPSNWDQEGRGQISLAHFLTDTTMRNSQTSGQSLATQKGPVSHLASQVVDTWRLAFLAVKPDSVPVWKQRADGATKWSV